MTLKVLHLAQASTLKLENVSKSSVEAAKQVGKLIAEVAKTKELKKLFSTVEDTYITDVLKH